MLDQIQFEEKFGMVMKHVFGKTMICRNLDTATQLSRSAQLDCVTLDGK